MFPEESLHTLAPAEGESFIYFTEKVILEMFPFSVAVNLEPTIMSFPLFVDELPALV